MKRIILVSLSFIVFNSFAQETNLPNLGEGQGVALSLAQLKDSALQHNIAIRNAQHGIEVARQQRKEAFTKYFPNISGTGLWFNANTGMAQMDVNAADYISPELGATLAQSFPPQALAALAQPMTVSMMKNGTIGSLMAVQPVFAGGQIVNGNKLARVGEDVSVLQLQLSKNEVEKTTEQYYWQLVTLQEKMNTVEAAGALLTDLAHDVDVAVKADVALRNDLLQVQLRQNDIESQKLKLQNGIDLVRLLLAQYCGLCSSEFRLESIGIATALDMDNGTAVANSALFTRHSTLESLPEYQLLQKQVEATTLQKLMAVGQQLPSVAVGAGYNYHNLLENDHTFGMIFATVSVPISDWWGGSHAIKRRKIEQQKAVEQLEDNAQLLQIRIQKARNDVKEASQQLQLAQQGVEQSEENLRLNRNFYKAGTCTMSDLLQAQLLHQQSLDKRVDAWADLQNRLLDYRLATGQ
ncbi:MAG: TolC family protein [Prevotella sp.]|nr:TolC family protein [Prevotella sp.]